MPPSKAERILSRYRPIAPKPLPLPPPPSFGTADPSSTCVSLDSFASSTVKCRKSRKRKADHASSAKGLKAPKPIASGISITGGASSLTQGASDGTVPREDLRSASQLTNGSIRFGVDDDREVRGTAAELRFTACSGGVAPMYAAAAGKLVHTQGFCMFPQATSRLQHQLSPMHQRFGLGPDPNCALSMNKDTGFLERAAAASASVMLERSSSLPICDVGCGKGMGYGGGGFTEMIRGITRLPTVADVQSLMHSRTSPPAGQGAAGAAGSPGACHSSPTSSRETTYWGMNPPPLSTIKAHNWTCGSQTSIQSEQIFENGADLVTLPLLPNTPSRICSPSMGCVRTEFPVAQTPLPSMKEVPQRDQVSQRVEQPCATFSSRSLSLPHLAVQVANGCPLSPSESKNASGLMGSSSSMQVAASAVVNVGTAMDERVLEQAYGGSTDPVLLEDEDSNKVLWYNKPYDKALKAASERLSGKAIPTGPYIDPLGHPTPLGSFAFPVYGKSVRARLWGFLKKLVIQESVMSSDHGAPGPGLRLSIGVAAQKISPPCLESGSRISPLVCSSNSQLTTVTLESITEFHTDVPATTECVEAAEARLAPGSGPAFITDRLNRVRWVNAALKQMLGHLSFDGSNSHVVPTSKGACGAMSDSTAFVICCTEKVPRTAWAFSCRVNLEWMKGGKRRSMTVPCDVTRLASSTRVSDVHWLWQFDMAVSLGLNVPS